MRINEMRTWRGQKNNNRVSISKCPPEPAFLYLFTRITQNLETTCARKRDREKRNGENVQTRVPEETTLIFPAVDSGRRGLRTLPYVSPINMHVTLVSSAVVLRPRESPLRVGPAAPLSHDSPSLSLSRSLTYSLAICQT